MTEGQLTERAFPQSFEADGGVMTHYGLSAWDYFAAHAPVPQCGGATMVSWVARELADMAAEYADAMMAERAKRVQSSLHSEGDKK